VLIARIPNATRVLGKQQGYLGLPVRDEVRNTTVDGLATPCMVTAWEPTPDELQRINEGTPIHLVLLGTQHPPVMIEVPYPADPQPWKAGVDDSADPSMIEAMHDIAGRLSHRTPMGEFIRMCRASAHLDQRTRLGYHIQCAILANAADRLEFMFDSYCPLQDLKLHEEVVWKLSWGYFNTKLRDAWAVFRRKAVALYV
jgi:hypothetical protein